jgi:hypothetical protein
VRVDADGDCVVTSFVFFHLRRVTVVLAKRVAEEGGESIRLAVRSTANDTACHYGVPLRRRFCHFSAVVIFCPLSAREPGVGYGGVRRGTNQKTHELGITMWPLEALGTPHHQVWGPYYIFPS